uniref:Apolipoprotein C-I-like n=1 Tax=Fundulus heteroclitus TaxID=8078 RepID=A0A3Q2QLB3_FUNHE
MGRDSSRPSPSHVDLNLPFCITLLKRGRLIKSRDTLTIQGTLFFFLLRDGKEAQKAKMRLYLAAAVLLLAFVAYTEAQDDSITDKFSNFGDQITEFGKNVAEKAKTHFDTISNSEFAANTRNWFTEQIEKLKTKIDEISQ